MKRLSIVTCIAMAAMTLSACSSTAPVAPPAAAKPAPTPSPPPKPQPAPQPPVAKPVAPTPIPAHLDPKSALYTNRSIYFDYDNYAIKSEFSSVIERHGKYLASNPSLAIKVEGNADERGSAEYNLALGQKRAEAVKRALKVYGAKDSQMEAISFGKEKPKSLGHDEAAWTQNRRVDLEYPRR